MKVRKDSDDIGCTYLRGQRPADNGQHHEPISVPTMRKAS